MNGLADFAAQAALGLPDQGGKQLAKHRAGATGIGVGKGRALRRAPADMVQTGRVAFQPADDLAQARSPGKLAVRQGDKLVLGGQPTDVLVCPMLANQTLERIPTNALQYIVEYSGIQYCDAAWR